MALPPLSITVLQSPLHWEDKDANLSMFGEKIKSLKGETEIVVLPEMFTTGFSMKPEQFAETMDGPTVTWMKKLAAENVLIITGSIMIEEGGSYFNRLLWVLPNGQVGTYDKRHCFAYAHEHEHYSPGNKRLIASVKGWKLNLMICYDLRFPVWARQSKPLPLLMTEPDEAPEYDVLIYVANWPERRIYAWESLLKARAIENQCYVIGTNRIGKDGNGIEYNGRSMFIDPLGYVVKDAGGDEAAVEYSLSGETLYDIRTKFPFLRDADHFRIGE
jgi:omega-amidase